MKSVVFRKLIAMLIDLALLAGSTQTLARALPGVAAALGDYAPLVGFVFAMLYFGAAGTELLGYRTLGHRVLGLAIAADSEEGMLPWQAWLRGAALAFPLSFGQGPFRALWVFNWIALTLSAGNLYLFLFNFKDGRLLHDFVARTRVVRSTQSEFLQSSMPLLHLGVSAALMVAAFVLQGLTIRVAANDPLINALTRQREILSASWMDTQFHTFSSKSDVHDSHFLAVTVTARPGFNNDERLARRAAGIAARESDVARSTGRIVVKIVHSTDFGIASLNTTRVFDHRTDEWLATDDDM